MNGQIQNIVSVPSIACCSFRVANRLHHDERHHTHTIHAYGAQVFELFMKSSCDRVREERDFWAIVSCDRGPSPVSQMTHARRGKTFRTGRALGRLERT